MNEDREFEEREQRIPSQMGALIFNFMKDVSEGEWNNRIHYAETMQLLVAAKNVDYFVALGILTMEQKLTLEASIPFLEYIVKNYFGTKRATLDLEFRVSAKRADTSKLTAGVHTKAEAKTGGLAGLLGAGGSFSVSADTTYQKDTRRESDYSSTVKVHVEMESMPPPETVAFMAQATQELVKDGMAINKQMIERQKDLMSGEAETAEVPKDVASPSSSGDSESSGGGGQSQQAAQPEA